MNKQGLTLIEVIVSAVILALTVGGVLYIFSTEKGVVARIGRQVQAVDFARQTLEELKNEVDADTWPNTGGLGTVGVAITEPLSPGEPSDFRDKFGGAREYTVTNIDADGNTTYEYDEYKAVTVKVEWTEPAESQ